MDNKLKKEIILNGLCCANCACKIERSVNNIDDVDNATLDFLSKKLIIELKDKDKIEEVLNKTTKIVNNIEPGIKVIYSKDCDNSKHHNNGHDHSHLHGEKNNNKKVIRLGIGLVIFVVATIFKFSFYTELVLFVISYILIGGEIILTALKNMIRGQVFDENFLMTIATIGAFSIKEFPEGVAVMLFYQVGEYFQDRAVDHSRKSISSLMDIRPDYANLKIEDDIKRVSLEEVSIGDIRSEEHTSELQSRQYLVCRLLLEKKKNNN